MKTFLVGLFVGMALSCGILSASKSPELEAQAELNKCRAEQTALVEYAGECLLECKKEFPFKPS